MLDIQFPEFPTLQTPRLVLREIVPADAEVLFALRRHPDVTKYLDRENDADLSVVHSLILTMRAAREAGDGVTWGLSLQDNPSLIGTLGFWRIDKKNHRAEIGYTLFPEHWGKGLMSEAMQAVLDFGFGTMKLHSAEANTAVGNRASHALLERFRFRKEAHFRENWFYNGAYSDSVIYCRLATD